MKPITVIVSFALPALCYFLYWLFIRLSYCFDVKVAIENPKAFELLYYVFYSGGIGLMLSLCFHAILTNRWALLFCVTAVALGSLDMKLNLEDEEEVRNSEKIIAWIGEKVSGIYPYTAQDTPLPSDAIAVLVPGQTVTATDKDTGMKMTITAGSGSMRTFCWDGVTRSLDVLKEDDYLHFPRRTRNPEEYRYIWKNHKGVKRCSYWERTHYFDGTAELEAWIEKQKKDDSWAYTENDGGILAAFSINCESNAIVVMVEKGVVRDGK